MSRKSRRKGHGFEREISAQLRVVFPNARRQLEYHSRDAKGIDIQETGRFKFQCKKLKQYASVNTIREIQCDFTDVPVLVTAGDNQPAMAVLPFTDFLLMLERLPKEELEGL